MAVIRLKRTSEFRKMPSPSNLLVGELALNTSSAVPGLFAKSSNNQILGFAEGGFWAKYNTPTVGMLQFSAPVQGEFQRLMCFTGTNWVPAAPFLPGYTLGANSFYTLLRNREGNPVPNATAIGAPATQQSTTLGTRTTILGEKVVVIGYFNRSLSGSRSVHLGSDIAEGNEDAHVYIGNGAGNGTERGNSDAGGTAIGYRAVSQVKTEGVDLIYGFNGVGVGANAFSNLTSQVSNLIFSYMRNMVAVGANAFLATRTNPYVVGLGSGVGKNVSFNYSNRDQNAEIIAAGFEAGVKADRRQMCIGAGSSTSRFFDYESGTSIGAWANKTNRYGGSIIFGSHYLPTDAGIRGKQIVFASGSEGADNLKLVINDKGAWSVNDLSYGTSGQVLMSNGNSQPPTWTTLASGSFKIGPTQTAVVTDGVITEVINDG